MKIGNEKAYRKHKAISRSMLLKLGQSPIRYRTAVEGIKTAEDEKPAFNRGSMIDSKVLTPELFKQEYILRPDDLKTPTSGNQIKFCELLNEGYDEYEAYSKSYSTKNKTEDKLKTEASALLADLSPYLNFVSECEERIPYTEKDAAILHNVETSIVAHPAARSALSLTASGVEVQVGLAATLYGEEVKVLIDHLKIDHTAKIVYNTDLKTTGKPIDSFPYWYRRYKYHVQQGLYKAILMLHLREIGLGDYKIITLCVAAETCSTHEARVYTIPDTILGEGLLEAKRLIELLQWHREKQEWKHTKEEIENNLIIPMVFKDYDD